MSENEVSFMSQCPNGHMPTSVFDREQLRKSLERKTLYNYSACCAVRPGHLERRKRKISKDTLRGILRFFDSALAVLQKGV